MEEPFDPYYIWLGIAPEDQPPTHYRLLGIRPFEPNPNVIQNAADRQMAHLRTFQIGKHSLLSQRLLNEVAAARVCLLSPAKRSEYDDRLRGTITEPVSRTDEPPKAEPAPPFPFALGGASPGLSRRYGAVPMRKRSPIGQAVAVLASALALLVFGVVYWGRAARGPPEPGTANGGVEKVRVRTSPDEIRRPVGPPARAGKASRADSSEAVAPAIRRPAPGPEVDGPERAAAELVPPRQVATAPSPPPGEPVPAAARDAPGLVQRGAAASSPGGAGGRPERRASLPSAADQEDALRLARDVYEGALKRARTVEEKKALARRLLGQASAASAPDAGTFALLRLAREISVQALDVTTALEATDAMGQRYRFDVPAAKVEVISDLAKKTRTSEQHSVLAKSAMRAMEEAAEAERFDSALRLAGLAIAEGEFAHDKDLVSRTKGRAREMRKSADINAQFQEARGRLKEAPDDPAANQAVGTYYCGVKNDWAAGLPHLAKGTDAGLRGLAMRELNSPPTRPTDQLALADAWWRLGGAPDVGNARPALSLSILRHAGALYAKAGERLTGALDKAKVEGRLGDLAAIERGSAAASASEKGRRAGERGPRAAAPAKSSKGLLSNAIVEGVGWRLFRVGATRAELISALGIPDNDPSSDWLQWRRRYHIHCLVDDSRGAFELRFDRGFPGRLTSGVMIGSLEEGLLSAYGKPDHLTDNGGGERKYEFSTKGVLFWTKNGRVSQIVVFRPYGG
jgi:hypothetical protein